MTSNVDAWVQQYVSWAEQQIAGVVVKAELHVQLVRVVRGPLTVTFQVGLLPQSLDKQSLVKLKRLDGIIGIACRTSSVSVDDGENGLINIVLPLPKNACTTPPAEALAKLTQGPNLCVGIDSLRQPVSLDLRQHGAVLWVGPSRSGKTQSIKSTMYTMLAQPKLEMRFIVIAHKIEDWEDMEGLRQCWGIAHTLGEMQAAVTWIEEEMVRRTSSKVKRPLIVVIADDMINLVEADPTFGASFGRIASQGAGMGINLLIGTQEAGSKRGTGDNSVENNVTARMVYRISNTQAASRSAGQGKVGVDKLSGNKGDALFILHGATHRIATGYVAEGVFDGLPQGAELAPWRVQRVQEQKQKQVVVDHNQSQPLQPATTAHNRLQPPTTTGEGMWYTSEKVDTRNDVAHPHVPTLVATTPTTTVATTAAEPVGSVEQVVERVTFPIKRRQLTAAERAEVRRLHGGSGGDGGEKQGLSERKLSFHVYGHRDGKTVDWIKEALGESAENPVIEEEPKGKVEPEAVLAKAGNVDDQQLLQMLLDKKLINWGETSKLNQGIMLGGAKA